MTNVNCLNTLRTASWKFYGIFRLLIREDERVFLLKDNVQKELPYVDEKKFSTTVPTYDQHKITFLHFDFDTFKSILFR